MKELFTRVAALVWCLAGSIACKTNGVIIAQAGTFGGWVLHMKDGKVQHEYNFFGLERTRVGGETALVPGKHSIQYEFIPDAGGESILTVNGQKIAEVPLKGRSLR